MHDLETERAASNLAVATQPHATCEPLLLSGGEVKEAQRERTGTIAEPTQQLSATAKRNFGELYLAFDDRAITRAQRAHRHDPGAVLVAQRQKEQQILNRRNTELLEARSQRLAHAFQRGDGAKLGRSGGRTHSGLMGSRHGMPSLAIRSAAACAGYVTDGSLAAPVSWKPRIGVTQRTHRTQIRRSNLPLRSLCSK